MIEIEKHLVSYDKPNKRILHNGLNIWTLFLCILALLFV